MTVDLDRVLAEFRPGLCIYIQGAGGEPLALRVILNQAPEVMAGVNLTGCFVPGFNEFDYSALHPEARLTSFMLPSGLAAGFRAGRVEIRPLPFSQIAAALVSDPAPDLAIFQVAPPDAEGKCSLGPCSDFAPLVWPRAGRRLAFINRSLPVTRFGPSIPFADIDIAIEADGPFIIGNEAPANAEQAKIAQIVADLIPDGAAIQTGIGAIPGVVIAHLIGRRNLVIRSGLVTDAYRLLAEAGALDPDAQHVTGAAHGSEDFMRWAARELTFADATVTHGAAVLAATPRLHAINSALEVDLFGQANVEWRSGRLASGLGGAPDFARGARQSQGGRAILAMPSTAKGGTISKIVGRLDAPTVSIPRDDTDLVVTEHGVADLRGKSLEDRAQALIAIAAPEHRDGLKAAWVRLRAGL